MAGDNKQGLSERKRKNLFKRIIRENLKATNEEILLIGDTGTKERNAAAIMTSYYKEAAEEMGFKHEELLQAFKRRGDIADDRLIKKLNSLPRKSIIIINISNKLGTLGKLGLSFRKYAKARQHRFISTPSLGTMERHQIPLLIRSLDIDYKESARKTSVLSRKLSKGSEISVTNKAGTDITLNISGKEGKVSTGVFTKPGTGGNIPGSEAYIAPNLEETTGTIAVDGSIRVKDKTILAKNPVFLQVKNGFVTKVSGGEEAGELKRTLSWAAKKAKYPERTRMIGELGIGTNRKAKILGSTIVDEKALGTAHFALGSNYWFGGSIKTIIHLDQVIRNPTMKIDGKPFKTV